MWGERMTQEQRAQNIVKRLRRCHRFLHHRADGGKAWQWSLRRELRFHGAMTQRMLQEHAGIRQSSLSELVKKMEEQGLIGRQVCPEDRRQIMISLTDQGNALCAEMEERNLKRNVEYLSVLSEQEQETLLELLTRLDELWQQEYACPRKEEQR